MGDGKVAAIEAISNNFRLLLETSCFYDLNDTFIVPSFRQNLVSISSLKNFGFSCSLGNNKVSLFQNSNLIGIGSLIDNLYMLDSIASCLTRFCCLNHVVQSIN